METIIPPAGTVRANMTPIAGPMPRTEEWFSLRRFNPDRKERPIVFGATKAAPICGMSPYTTPLEVFVECTIGIDREPTDAMLDGLDYESAVLNIYERRRKCVLERDLPMYFHSVHSWMGATPDALARWKRGPNEPMWGVDAKTTTYRRLDKEGGDEYKFGVEGTDQIPIDYIFQAVQQCAVLNLPYVEFPVSFSRSFQPIYRVERNEEIEKFIIFAETEMYERLLANDPPEPNWTHENTRELISLLHGYKEDVVKQLDADDAEQWLEVQRWKDEIKDREQSITEANNKLLFKLQGASAGILPSGNEQIKRIVVKESKVTQKDVDDLRERVGQTKRKGYEFLKQPKVK